MPTPRPASERRDAQRNRRRIIDAATRAFQHSHEPVSLESIAAAAGVGVGTLYRNFESREALVAEVYRVELDRLCASPAELLRHHSPEAAMRLWMRSYQDFVATKHGMADGLRALIARGAVTSTRTRAQLADALELMLRAGGASGELRVDVDPSDIAAGLAGTLLAAVDAAQAVRMLDLLVDGCLAH